ncbi:ferroxidase, multicopper oxidase [Laccaria bicolor S238N-H82]|uniref:Ferroxidase, multicopper oxidase n=2 Tax=Laccaria bicolor TaxID=29883 RepID=B0DRW0_LACBS|nr:ferroxidase, multicopper oxidase [Laccaria bicolor S238N-H82]ACN49098.1 ferroxidase [Laccaria bicolor]EDR02682.1 ferroxidase, multicopper oxidase [Laccaria bicolor S238N-H82]|eukprot:XP_001886726.1 ferroxidase, multicopper oxidase [Laccaria bicolor S238N-H82]
MLPTSLIILAALASPALAGVQEIWWNLTYVQNANPDGLFPQRVVSVNGSWPHSLLVHVTNSLSDPATLHHHGMFFKTTSWMDGAQGIMVYLPPGGTFDYIVPVNTSGQWGTYWMHGHSSGQYVDGLRAPLVLHPPKKVAAYDEEFTKILGDWYHEEHAVLLEEFINIANPGGAGPVPESGLMYFAQNSTYLGPIAGSNPAPVTNAVGFNENATLPFQPGKTYRLRIVNTAAFAMIYFWIDGHDMRIIEVDGTDVEEYPIDLIALTVAQRYSILVTARNDTSSNWAIHANMDTDMFDILPDLLADVTSSITYNASAPLTDNGFVDEYHDVNDTALVPVIVVAQPAATKTIELEVSFDTVDDGTNREMFNGITHNNPLVPAVLSDLTLDENATVPGAYGPTSFIDIVIKNGDAGKHPFPLHGHKPMLVGRATDYTSSDPTLNPPIIEGQANPIRRDVVGIPSMGSATMRVVAGNPGVWFLHCHIEWHLEVGLSVQFVEAPLQAQQHNGVPQKLLDNCKALNNIPTSKNAAGIASATDLHGLPLGPYPQILGWRPRGIGAMFRCVLTGVQGMLSVVWFFLCEDLLMNLSFHLLFRDSPAKGARFVWSYKT